jgi:predicted ribosomally synthesized peptide with nif11-like leader
VSHEEFASFVELVAEDPELQAAWNEVSSDASRLVALAAQRGFDITEEELKSGLKAVREADGVLDDSELEQVAGGLALGMVSRRFKKAQFYEGWPCKWNVPDLKSVRQKF